MSMECGDCEWNTYMGHHESCSRYDKEQQDRINASLEDTSDPMGV